MPDTALAAGAAEVGTSAAGEAGSGVFRGRSVCGSVAIGPLVVVGPAAAGKRKATGDPAAEADALRTAIAAALAALEEALAAEDDLAGEILEFQAALLEDDDLTGPAFTAIAGGAPADRAWTAALAAEIDAYRADGDPVLSARGDDLADLSARVLAHLTGKADPAADVPRGAIVAAAEMTPSAFLALSAAEVAGIATTGGSPTSHVAILAKARGVPLVVGLNALPAASTGPAGAAILDAAAGTLHTAPDTAALAAARARSAEAATAAEAAAARATQPAVTRDGAEVKVMVNIDDPAILGTLDPAICDGVGLTRTEFLFQHGAPDEEAQLAFYTRLIAWADGRPVTIRTLDAGGDKPLPGITVDGEANPFLGVRGVRLSLARPELTRVQLRALARAASTSPVPLKVMVPMVTVPAELEAMRALLTAEVDALAAARIAHAAPVLGTMVEVPAAALTAARFDAAFYSIGSNDLVQYATAAARDNAAVAPLADPANPAVLELISRTVAAGKARGVEVSLCGDMASTPALAAALLATGLRVFSAAPAEVAAVKDAIRSAAAGPAA